MSATDELASGRVRTSSGDVLRLGKAINSGFEGTVVHVEGKPTVVKIFHEGKRRDRERKVRAMIANPPVDPTDHQTIVWPLEVVETTKSGSFVGYEMDYVDLSRYEEALDYAYGELRWSETEWDDRCKAALNMSLAVILTHKQGHALGDMNHQNILIKDGKVTLIDCDAFDVQGPTDYYPGETEHERYAPPTGRGDTRRAVQYADRFGLGVHVFQLLMQGYHPYQTRGRDATAGTLREKLRNDPFPYHQPEPGRLEPHARAPDYSALPASVRALFEQCFVEGKTRPRKRPAPEEWEATLRELYGGGNRRARGRTRPRVGGGNPREVGSPPDARWAAPSGVDPITLGRDLGTFLGYALVLFAIGFALHTYLSIGHTVGALVVLTLFLLSR